MRATLQQARKAKTHTQKQVANYLGIATNAYQAIELGTRGTSEENWLKLYEYYGEEIPLHKLMRNTPKEKSVANTAMLENGKGRL